LYKTEVSVQALYTFASPNMGDQTFVNVFNGLGLESWRIINEQDIVQYVPPGFFEHVNTVQPFDSRGKVQQSISCCHAIATYLSLLDPTLKPDPACQLPAPAAADSV
jgi:hypothetical protein